MPYSVQADILNQLDEETLIQLTDDPGDGEVDDDVVTRAIADADATVDSYCQGRYVLPLSPVPPKVRQVSVDISIYNLYSRRGDTAPDTRKDRHKEAVRWLEKVAEGKVELGADTPASDNTAQSVEIESEARAFTRTKMKGF